MTARRSGLRSSRYNFCVPLGDDDSVLYNAGSGASIRLAGTDVAEITKLLCGPPRNVATRTIPSALLASLRRGGFLVEQTFDEVAAIRERYWVARGRTPMVLTLTTTQDCNLGCYCYEERSRAALSATDVPAILDWTRERLAVSGKDSLHVDWYGGEPLLNIAFIEVASEALQSLCNELNVSYSASVISNGTCWPDDVAGFIRRHRIRQAQISFDGLKANHDKRRRYRRGRAPGPGTSSFDQAVALVDKLLEVVHVDLRFNSDRGNSDDLEPLVAFCRERGWFDRPFPCVFQLARISDYSERTGFMSQAKLSEDEFERLRERARHLVPNETNLDETTTRSLYPLPRSSVCAALADDSIVVGADGHRYRCGLQVGEKKRPVAFAGKGGAMSPGPDAPWWDDFDPTRQPNCSRCSFLPVCWGGCPKKHLEGDTASLHEQSLYWRKALPQKIAWHFGVAMDESTFAFSESDQFR